MGSFSLITSRGKSSLNGSNIDKLHLKSIWSLGSSVSTSNSSTAERETQPRESQTTDDESKDKAFLENTSLSCRMMAAWYCSDDDNDSNDDEDTDDTTTGDESHIREIRHHDFQSRTLKCLRPPSIVVNENPNPSLRAPSMTNGNSQ